MARKQLGVAASNAADAIKKSELDAAVVGGGGAPGGSTTQLQFNDGGVFAGDADLTWNKTTNTLGLGGADTGLNIQGVTNEPAAPADGIIRLYGKRIAGRSSLKTKGASGVDTPLQNALWGNNILLWTPTAAAVGLWIGTTGSGGATYARGVIATTTLFTTISRGRYSNVVTTLNQAIGQRMTEAIFLRGAGVGGGFFFFARFGFDTWTNGGRLFAGMHSAAVGAVTSDIQGDPNLCGFMIDPADNGLISFVSADASANTKISTGFTAQTNKGYDTYIFCKPSGTEIHWRIVDINTGAEASGVVTTNLPVGTTPMGALVQASNAALTPVNSIQLGINRIYIETDY